MRLFIEMNRTDGNSPFQLMTTFPKKVFTDEDYDTPLDVLGMLYIDNLLLYTLSYTYVHVIRDNYLSMHRVQFY